MSTRSDLLKFVQKYGSEYQNIQTVRLGNLAGTVLTGTDGILWARQWNGKEIQVYNRALVPADFDLRVLVGTARTQPTKWFIIQAMEDYLTPAGGGRVAYHHTQHEFPNADTVWVNRKQITQLTAIVSSAAGFVVQVYGAIVRTALGYKKISTQLVDLSSYVPASGAYYVSIETDNNGILSVNDTGANFEAPSAASVAYVPEPGPGKYLVAFVLLYADQTELTDDDIAVPMPMQSGGGVSSSLGWINVMDYGAVGDGVTDDTTAIATAIAALPSTGGVLYFPPGEYLTSGGFTIAVPCLIMGTGQDKYLPDDSYFLSRVLCNSATAALFTFTAIKGEIREISLANVAGSTPSAGAGIVVTNAASNLGQCVHIKSVSVSSFYTDIDVQVGSYWVMDSCFIQSPIKYGIRIRNIVNGDAGDWCISNCAFGAGVNSDAAIRIESSGGGKIINTKINGESNTFNHGIDLASTVGGTGNFQVSNCSIENVRGHGISLSGTAWHSIAIHGNQFGLSWSTGNNTGNAINVNGAFDGITISNNVMTGGTAPVAISLTSAAHVKIVGNVNRTFSDLVAQSGCTDVIIIESAAATPASSVVSETSYGQSSAVGTGTTYARNDHTHGTPALATATPAEVGSAGAAGSGTTPSKNDHVHKGVHSVNGMYGDVTVAGGQYRQFVWADDGAGGWMFVTSGGKPVFVLQDLE